MDKKNANPRNIDEFFWYVANRYYWEDNCCPIDEKSSSPIKKNGVYIRHPHLVEFEIKGVLGKSYQSSIIQPFKEKIPFMVDFLRLKEAKEDILKYANKYGLLKGSDNFILCISDKGEVSCFKDGDKGFLGAGDSWATWINEMREFKTFYQVWELIRKNEPGKLGQVIIWNKKGSKPFVYFNYFNQGSSRIIAHSKDEIFNKLRFGEVIAPAKLLLLQVINEKLKNNVSMRLFMDENNEYYQGIAPQNLISAIWYQFLQTVSGKRKIIRCEVCNELMDVTGKSAKLKQHLQCKQNKTQDDFKKRKKIYTTIAGINGWDYKKAKKWVLNKLEDSNSIPIEGYTPEEIKRLFENVLKRLPKRKIIK